MAAAVLVGVLVLAVVVDAFASAGRVHPGVVVSGVSVGGMNPEAATKALEAQLPAKADAPVTVVYGKKTWTVKPEDLGLTFDYPDLAVQAMAVGRGNGFASSISERVRAWFGGVELPAQAVADAAKMEKVLGEIAKTTNVPPRDAAVEIKNTTVSVNPSADGVELEREQLSSDMRSAFTLQNRTVAVPVKTALPTISNKSAEAARVIALQMISSPVTVTYTGKQWTFRPAEIGKMIEFRAQESSATSQSSAASSALEPIVSPTAASKMVAPKLGADVGKPAVDARFKTSNGTVTVVPSQDGIGADMESLAVDLTAALKSKSPEARTVEIKTTVATPKLTTQQAREMGVQERISTFTTTYDAGNQSRVNNIHTLGSALDGKLVAPGATFSFNGAVGERTAAKGYQEANAIVNGKLVPQLGGGICQVGTTLFNTVFFSGFPVLERQNHSFYISHYPTGRDATVSWGGPDLKWKNDTKNWVLVSVSYTEDSITMALYGTNPKNEVAYTTGPFTNETPYPIEKVPDPTLAAGLQVVQDRGLTGRKCVVTRTVTKAGQPVRKDTFVSVYKPKIEVVRIGTKVKGSKTVTSTVVPKP